jgi:hypothetical protein
MTKIGRRLLNELLGQDTGPTLFTLQGKAMTGC